MDGLNILDAMPGPYREESINLIYNLLFCDNIALYRNTIDQQDQHPWNILLAESANAADLKKIVDDDQTESRMKILAHHLLREKGEGGREKDLLGVIVEVGLDEGLDVLAAYRDGRARYINYTGKMIILETANTTTDALTIQLFRDCENIVKQIGPWDKARRPQPVRGVVRITFLVSDGLYFGEGPIAVLFNDALAGPALRSATQLMQYLTENALILHRDSEGTEKKPYA